MAENNRFKRTNSNAAENVIINKLKGDREEDRESKPFFCVQYNQFYYVFCGGYLFTLYIHFDTV